MMKKKKTKKEYSKKMATLILAVALFDVQLTYILAFFNKEIAETLSVGLVTEIIGIYVIYCLKAYFGKKGEENTRLKEKEQDYQHLNGMEEIDYGLDEDN